MAPAEVKAPEPALLTVAAAARWLGVSRQTLAKLVRDGRLEVIRLSPESRARVRRRDIEALVNGSNN